MRKKILGIGLLMLGLFGLVFGAVAAYQGEPGPNPDAMLYAQEDMQAGAQAMAMKGHGHGMRAEERGQYMGLGVNGQYLEEVDVDSGEVQEYLNQLSVEEFTNPRGITVQKLVYDGDYVGKIVGDYDLSELSIYKAYETLNGVKVFLSYDDQIVGFFRMA
ncbi:hypothetical protein EP1X_04620 [Thermococcus sp. EP1]|uniref:hypothetical protein n=1 Tax=Thermococcus sp. EP1 TaxID=1591054 RepID=UPI0006DACD19|nr:hypothetical protein [Thermococcus sp. EP1]KPU63077.1 hypothetical protein EP1X_04620 [Thermococcus sp. EP1]